MSDAAQLRGEDDWAGLMARAQAGDAVSYRRLLIAVTPYLRAIAARSHRERHDVEDSLQDILLTVHAVRHTYDPARPFKPWLAAIARRRIIDRLRGQGRKRARETFLSEEHETFAAPETNLTEAEPDFRALRAAVEQLPEGQRQAITMLKIEEKSLKEASAASGMSIVALKVSTHRAVKNLRKLLDRRRDGI
ncbi:MAG TPA: sigma-70 family RNA polymerase sigma factor [Micropepsaceae bacterium]